MLTKSDSKDHGMKKLLTSSIKEEKQQPTIIIKTREGERAISPNSKSNSSAASLKYVEQRIYDNFYSLCLK